MFGTSSAPGSPLHSPRSERSFAWLTPKRSMSGPRLRMFGLALVCMYLGYLFVTMFTIEPRLGRSEVTQYRGSSNGSSSVGNGTEQGGWGDRVKSWNPWKKPESEEGEGESEEKHEKPKGKGEKVSPKKNGTEEEYVEPNMDQYALAPRVAKCTILFGSENKVYERALRTHVLHNRKHGYPMYTLRQGLLDDTWTKPAYIMSLILRELAKPPQERLQWILWVDADTIMLNPLLPIEMFLPPEGEWDDVHLLVSDDWNGLNNGVFPIRVHPWSVEMLSAIVSFRHYKPDYELVFRDQSAMEETLRHPKFKKHYIKTPQRWFNAYQGEVNETLAPFQARRGDFLVHFAGVGDRDERMKFWLHRAEQHLPDWEVEPKHTSYPSEIEDFWKDEAAKRVAHKKVIDKIKEKYEETKKQKEESLKEYGDRLSEKETKKIEEEQERVHKAFEDENKNDDEEILNRLLQNFKMSLYPLEEHTQKSKKTLMKEAHEIIFTAEQATFTNVETPAIKEGIALVEESIKRLKALVLMDPWPKESVRIATDELRREYTDLKEKIEAAEKAERRKKQKEEEEKKQKEEEEKQKEEERIQKEEEEKEVEKQKHQDEIEKEEEENIEPAEEKEKEEEEELERKKPSGSGPDEE